MPKDLPLPPIRVLNLAGLRLIRSDHDQITIGMWQDVDCQELRAAISDAGAGHYVVVYLDSPSVPREYKERKCPVRISGEPFSDWLVRAERMAERRVPPKRAPKVA